MFGDHAVLQRGKPVPVWGNARPGQAVTVAFRGREATTVAGADGRWSVTLDSLNASADPSDLSVTGGSTVVLHDIVVGDVWLCSGQSNMEFTVDDGGDTYRVANAEAEVAAAKYPLIRQLKVERTVATSPQASVPTSGWIAASPKTAGQFTAVGYFFARDLFRTTGIPIGLIDSPWGGTPIESWIPDAARERTSIAARLDKRWKDALDSWPPERIARYPLDVQAWEQDFFEAKQTGAKMVLDWPQPPATPSSPALPGGLYNAMIAPLQPCALRGILWYQGESNVGHADEYAELFGALITSWRAGWGQGDLPFYFVQLANFGDVKERVDRGWALLREAQQQALLLPATGMAVTVDIGEAENIHPRNKQEVGRRLALIAKDQLYGVHAETSGPLFQSAEVEGAAIRVRFTHASGPLVSRNGPVCGLEIAGDDRRFVPAEGVIDGATLVVASAAVKSPVAVRYAWTNAPVANLYNESGLPAAPFRSDNW